jgi:hypothetical protein
VSPLISYWLIQIAMEREIQAIVHSLGQILGQLFGASNH